MTLRLVRDSATIGEAADHELALNVHQQRRCLGMPDEEPTELTFFCHGRISVAHALTAESHCQLLRAGERLRDFTAAYMLVNGPIDCRVLARYKSGEIHRATNGRVTDKEIETRRALFIDVDPQRPKGISATESEKREAHDVARAVYADLARKVGITSLAFGDSGNGFFVLLALEPCAPTPETTARISRLLGLLDQKFSTEHVKIDRSVSNAARLMPAAGTWKRKGEDTLERPHRLTSFSCRGEITRIPLEALA